MANLIFEPGLRALKRLIEAVAVWVVLPPVISAPDAVRLDKAVVEGCPPVRAVLPDEAVSPAWIAKQHEIFAEDSYSPLGLFVVEIRCCPDHVPVAPEELACRSSTANTREQLVLFMTEHGISSFSSLTAARAMLVKARRGVNAGK
jgi:hypothetical protein